MNCRQAQRQIFAEHDRDLTDGQSGALAAHLAQCEACRSLRERMAAAIDSWRADAQHARVPDSGLEWQKVRRALHEPAPRAGRRGFTWLSASLATAAAVVSIGLYVSPARHQASALPTVIAAKPVMSAPDATAASTVVYVDDQSGWTFVLSPAANGRPG